MTRKKKQKTWWQLKDSKCPTCGIELNKGMFNSSFTGCQNCGFIIEDNIKDLLIKRDHNE